MRWLWVFVLAGCLDAQLVPCGELSCPVGSTCIDNVQCATDEQLAACTAAADGELCVTSSGNGTCQRGACVVARCGDGIVDPGEVCDDGNLVSRDGCRQDCRSDESCGNGILDADESCDCGSSAETLQVGCVMPNSDDVTAQCDLACSRRCGDGVVTGSEQCDGLTIPVTCDDLGFYTGTPGCTSYCALDAATCSGECGDMVVQSAEGELCDGSPPAGSCVTFGRDFGPLLCNAFCGPDIVGGCNYFLGWRLMLALNVRVAPDSVAVNARGIIAMPGAGTGVAATWDGVTVSRSGTGWNRVAATRDSLLAFGPTTYGWFDGTWHDHAVAVAGAPAATSTGSVYLVTSSCTVSKLEYVTGVVTSITAAPATTCATPVVIDDMLYVAGGTAGLLKWNGTAWSTEHSGTVSSIQRGRYGHLISGVSEIDVRTSPAQVGSIALGDSFGAMSIDGTAVWQYDSDPDNPDDGLAHYVKTGALVSITSLSHDGSESRGFGQTEDGTVFAAIHGGVYRLEAATVSTTLDGATLMNEVHVVGEDEAVSFCGSRIAWLDGGGSGARPYSGTCLQILGDPRTDHLMVGQQGPINLYRWDTQLGYVSERAVGAAARLVTDGTSTLLLDGAIYLRSGTAWNDVTPSGCSQLQLAGNETGIYALGVCSTGATILRWNGTAFDVVVTALNVAGLTFATVADDGTFVFGSNAKHFRLDGTTLVEYPGPLQSIRALSVSERFGRSTNSPGSLIHVKDGITSEIRVPAGPFDVTRDNIYYWDNSLFRAVAIPRLRHRLPDSQL